MFNIGNSRKTRGFSFAKKSTHTQAERRNKQTFELLEARIALSVNVAGVEGFSKNGPADQRIDIVFVGDGWVDDATMANDNLNAYKDIVDDVLDVDRSSGIPVIGTSTGYFSQSPFLEYAGFFNVHRVDVVSAEAGIDGNGLDDKNTALNGGVHGTDNRLRVLDTFARNEAVAHAPGFDLIQTILNGSGRANAGGNNSNLSRTNSADVHLHELGHSLGGLGDEYFPGGITYSGGEPGITNLTVGGDIPGFHNLSEGMQIEQMVTNELAWYRWFNWDPQQSKWVGFDNPNDDVGPVGVWPGGGGDGGGEFGIYRPTELSKMRGSSFDFDPVSKEEIIIKIYEHNDISPVLDATASGTYFNNDEFEVFPMTPEDGMTVRWSVDGVELEVDVVDPSTPNIKSVFRPTDYPSLPTGIREIKAEVVDMTDMVRNEDARDLLMTETRTWTYVKTGPKVTGVTISGSPSSGSQHLPYPVPTDFNNQLRTIPVGHADTITIDFSSPVTVQPSALRLVNATTGEQLGSGTINHMPGTNTASWTFATPFDAGQMSIVLDDSLVVDGDNTSLDGEWVNPITLDGSESPALPLSNFGIAPEDGSGDKFPGGDFVFNFTILPGDALTRDNLVNIIDESVLNSNYSIDVNGQWFDGDFDGNGDVNTTDYSDYLLPNKPTDFTQWPGANQLPIVTGVTISGSASVHDPYAMPMGTNGTDPQLKTVPVGGADTIEVHFSEYVNLKQSDLKLVSSHLTSNAGLNSTFSFDAATNTAKWIFDGAFVADQLYILLDSEEITDVSGNTLDGEWVNPLTHNGIAPKTESGDNNAGGDFAFAFTILTADTNRDNKVDFLDSSKISANFPGEDVGLEFEDGDTNGDGDVDFLDVSAVSNQITAIGQTFLNWPDALPQVKGVTISGPNENDINGGSYPIPSGNGDQIKTVPIGGANSIQVTFSEFVHLTGNELTLAGADGTNDYTPELEYDSFDITSNTATWRLTSDQFDSDQMVLTIDGTTTDIVGNMLDGHWNNPTTLLDSGTSDFENGSGNGTAGESFVFYFTILAGDFNTDNVVDLLDNSIVSSSFNQGTGDRFTDGDANGSGVIDTGDINRVAVELPQIGDEFLTWPQPPAPLISIISGDFNADGNVSGSDFLAWQRGDAEGNLTDWRSNFGQGLSSSTNGDNAATFSPEAEAIDSILGLTFDADERGEDPATNADPNDLNVVETRQYSPAKRQRFAKRDAVTVSSASTSREVENELEQYWLSDELLEKVFG